MIALLPHRNLVYRKISLSPHVILFLDYDGTLSPIVKRPEKAALPKRIKNLLKKLKNIPSLTVCIVSGRSLADITKRVGVRGLAYAGNHGLEASGSGFTFINASVRRSRKAIKRLSRRLRSKLKGIKGTIVEDKGLSISVHYRLVEKKDLPTLSRRFFDCVRDSLSKHKIKLVYGKKIFEVRPPVAWDKGKFVKWFIARIKKKTRCTRILPVYMGDDMTDEDAFYALRKRGITIFVGGRKKSFAKYRVSSVNGVYSFLNGVLKIKRGRGRSPNGPVLGKT